MSIIILGLLLYFGGKHLVRRLGIPRSFEDVAKWGFALFVLVVVVSGLPELFGAIGSIAGDLPSTDAGESVALLLITGLGVIGYRSWRRQGEDVQHEPRLLPRRRALPPPPQAEHHKKNLVVLETVEEDE